MNSSLDVTDHSIPLPNGFVFREYCRNNPTYARSILDRLLNSQTSLSTAMDQHISLLKSYLTVDRSFDDFCQQIRKYDNSVLCGHVWIDATISYRCRTCAMIPCMSLCSDCFLGGNHQGHDANMFRSAGGGVCDCGDTTVMNSMGFCTRHGPHRIPNASIPLDLIQTAKFIIPQLLNRLVEHLRTFASPRESNLFFINVDFSSLSLLFDLFDDLCQTGSVMRLIFIEALLDQSLQADPQQTCKKQIETMAKLSIPLTLRTNSSFSYFPRLNINSRLDEFLFWMVKYQIPERLLKIFLMLLTEIEFKKAMLPSFLRIYGMVVAQWSQTRASFERRHSLRLVHLSVQLFSNSQLAEQAIHQHQLLEMMLSSLFMTFASIKTNSQLQNPHENYHLVIAEKSFSKSMHYWPLISDWINILSHSFVRQTFLTDQRYFVSWIEMISWFQGMNVHHRHMNSTSLIDFDTNYSFAFNVETECCAMTLWTVISQLIEPIRQLTSRLIHRLSFAIKQWLSAIGIRQYNDIDRNQATFHLPLHRYLSILIFVALEEQNVDFKTCLPITNEDFLLNLIVHPLRLQILRYELNTNNIWSYNNYEMQIQLTMYSSNRGNLASYMNDADLFLIQFVSTLVDSNTFIKMFFHSFYVSEWLIQNRRKHLSFDSSTYVTLLEGSLIILAAIVSFSPHLALDDFQCQRAELINTLAVQDSSYSFLEENVAEPKNFSMKKVEIDGILNDIAEFVPPTIDFNHEPREGQYRPKDLLWETEFDPLHVLLRLSRRDTFETTMQRYSQWAKSTHRWNDDTNLWPPFRLRRPKDQFQTDLRGLLQSRYLHGILFSICLWMNEETNNIQEDILALLVYLCELAIDDNIRRSKYGEFLNGSASAVTNPPIYHNNHCITSSSLSLNDELLAEAQFKSPPDRKTTQFLSGIQPFRCDGDENVRDQPLDIDSLERLYGSRAIPFDELTEAEQRNQRHWDALIKAHEIESISNETFYTMPSYDIENHFRSTIKTSNAESKNNNAFDDDRQSENPIDGKFETFYQHDDFLVNVHKIIDEISFEEEVIVLSDDQHEISSKDEKNCSTIDHETSTEIRSTSVQTESKRIVRSKRIDRSIVQLFVDLLLKLIANEKLQEKKSSLIELLEIARRRKDVEQLGDGKVHLARLLIKFGSLSSESRIQIDEIVTKTVSTSNSSIKDQFKTLQEKIFETMSKKQQKIFSMSDNDDESVDVPIENGCCVCQSSMKREPLGLVVRFCESGVLGIRSIETQDEEENRENQSETNESTGLGSCCVNSTILRNEIEVSEENPMTCGKFYEEKIAKMFKMFSKNNVHESMNFHWRCGLIVDSCRHSIHFSCFDQHLKSHRVEFKCPMCRQTSNALLFASNRQQNSENEVSVEIIEKLLSETEKPCIREDSIGFLTNFLENLYKTFESNGDEINDENLAVFLLSLLRFNLEHELFVSQTENLDRTIIERKSCFLELFSLCALKFPYLIDETTSNLWLRVVGRSKNDFPILLSDPFALLLRFSLILNERLTPKIFRFFVRIFFDLNFVQSVLDVVRQMSRSEQIFWSENVRDDRTSSLEILLKLVATKFVRTKMFSSKSKIESIESIEKSVRTRHQKFVDLTNLLENHLFDSSSRFDDEISLKNVEFWLDELFQIDVEPLVVTFPQFVRKSLIKLPKFYADVLKMFDDRREKRLTDPIVCLICGKIFAKKRSGDFRHYFECSRRSNVFLHLNSTKIFIEENDRSAFWSSLYLDEHGEEDPFLRRGRVLCFQIDRWILLNSAWITSNLSRLVRFQ